MNVAGRPDWRRCAVVVPGRQTSRPAFLADVEPARSTLRTDMLQGLANVGGNSLPTRSANLAWATGLAKLPMGTLLMVRVA